MSGATQTSRWLQEYRSRDIEQFVDVIAGLVKRGPTFTSDASALVISLTGGH